MLFRSPAEAESIARSLNAKEIAVKSQIHSGGRGKAGGIKIVKTPEEAGKATKELIGKTLVTKQTGAQMWIEHDKTTHEKLKKSPQFYE